LDTALKHRLTGAVILVLLAVLLLPELLTGSGEAAKSSSAVTNNAGDGERRFEVDLTESASAPASALPQPQAQPQPAAEAPIELPVPATTPPPANATPPVPAVAAVPDQATVTPAPKAEPKAEPKVEPKPETKPAAKPEPKPAAKPAGTYYVQIGVFVSSSSARRLERQLRDKKFAVVVDEITRSGKTMFRVRVGPEIDRAAANALAKKLADAGHKGSVVK
jgi:DedD protein